MSTAFADLEVRSTLVDVLEVRSREHIDRTAGTHEAIFLDDLHVPQLFGIDDVAGPAVTGAIHFPPLQLQLQAGDVERSGASEDVHVL
ncbi:hypothetical protein FQZ97_1030730 [compost metagenome]